MSRFLFLLLLVVGGCVTRVETTQRPQTASARPAPQRRTVVDKRVVLDPVLDKVMRIVGVKAAVGSEDFLKIQVDVQNLTDSPRQFSYRIEWFDQDGHSLPLASLTAMPWMLLNHETSFLAVTAPTPAARDFRITFFGPGN